MKKIFYVAAFGFLGLIVSTLLHGVVELFALDLIFSNPTRFSNTFWWQEWYTIHAVVGGALWIFGLVGGVYLGVRYWRIIYVEGKRRKNLFGLR